MLEAIVGSVAAFDISNSQVQKRLLKLESGGLLVSELVGRTRLYQWNPRNPLVPPFRALLAVPSGGAAAQICNSG